MIYHSEDGVSQHIVRHFLVGGVGLRNNLGMLTFLGFRSSVAADFQVNSLNDTLTQFIIRPYTPAGGAKGERGESSGAPVDQSGTV